MIKYIIKELSKLLYFQFIRIFNLLIMLYHSIIYKK